MVSKTKKRRQEVSIPSSSGPGFGRVDEAELDATVESFQSPLHRGLGSDKDKCRGSRQGSRRFNPLFIGAWVRTWEYEFEPGDPNYVSIPSSSGPGFGR